MRHTAWNQTTRRDDTTMDISDWTTVFLCTYYTWLLLYQWQLDNGMTRGPSLARTRRDTVGLDGTALIFFDFNTWIEAHEGHKDGDASSGLHGRDSDGGLIFLALPTLSSVNCSIQRGLQLLNINALLLSQIPNCLLTKLVNEPSLCVIDLGCGRPRILLDARCRESA